jgi:tRNA 5-methylaminomethyl-2-thiouridine biosynthesis bifunctional protein
MKDPGRRPAAEAEAAALSFQNPETGEWAHARGVDLFEEAWRSYLEPAWPELLARQGEAPEDRPLRVAEVGFGRGINLAVLARRWHGDGQGRSLEALAFEPHPQGLEPWPALPAAWRPWAPWWGCPATETEFQWDGLGTLQRLACGAEEQGWPGAGVDLVVLDLFSPGRHPASWSPELFARLAAAAHQGTLVTSYSCARLVKDRLAAVGFEARRIRRPGWRDTLLARPR